VTDIDSRRMVIHVRWEITVLAAARLGCNLDYDKLQDLAESHRSLRQIMGIGDWQSDEVDFDWRRIEDDWEVFFAWAHQRHQLWEQRRVKVLTDEPLTLGEAA
jgi:hypothetical protein